MADNRTGQGQGTPWYLWPVGALALLWNGFGTFLWGGTTFMPDMAMEGMTAAHRAYVDGLPVWATFTWGLGVLGGVAGSILLLLRNRLAMPMFALSLLGAVANMMVYLTNKPPAGFFDLPLTMFIIGFALFLLFFAHFMKRRGVL